MQYRPYRGKCKEANAALQPAGKWVEGACFQAPDDDRIFIVNFYQGWPLLLEVEPETVGQFTGRQDINGQRIFEGDVVIAKLAEGNWRGFSWGLQKVVFNDGAFCLEDYRGKKTPFTSYAPHVEFEVVGNISDNPELLEAPCTTT